MESHCQIHGCKENVLKTVRHAACNNGFDSLERSFIFHKILLWLARHENIVSDYTEAKLNILKCFLSTMTL